MRCHLKNNMSNVLNLQIKGTEAQAAQFQDNCRRTELLFAGTLMKRFEIPQTDENCELVAGWLKSTRDIAVANWVSCGLQASNHEHAMPLVVCLCGSTKFWKQFQKSSLDETMAGHIVLSIGAASGTDDDHFGNLPREEYERVKLQLDELHKRKIDMADEILVLNVGGYIGDSTRSEIAYALEHGKPVRWLEDTSDELCREFGVLTTPPQHEPGSDASA